MARKIKVALKVLDYIAVYKAENDGLAPDYQEIANHFGFSSVNAWNHVERLARMGKIQFDEQRRYRINGQYIPPDDV